MASVEIREDEFLSKDTFVKVEKDLVERKGLKVLGQVREMFRKAAWGEMTDLYYPVDAKAPEICGSEWEASVRANLAFALGQLGQFDEAMAELSVCLLREPDNFRYHSSMAYTAYNSLYAAKNREIFLHGPMKKERIALAATHMDIARKLRPDSIANVYRLGMLIGEIEGKKDRALPHFMEAVAIWEGKTPDEVEAMIHERKHYIKALYHAAGCQYAEGSLSRALELVCRCIELDKETAVMGAVFKHFLKGKTLFAMKRHDEADKELEYAFAVRGEDPAEYVLELRARNRLAKGDTATALTLVRQIPKNRKRPYCRWTEADVLCALERYDEARQVLTENMDRDKRSRHKSLIRLVKIEYLHQRYTEAARRAAEAGRFFREAWGKPCADALFWESLSAFRAGNRQNAAALFGELESQFAWYPGLARLRQLVLGGEP